MCQRSSECWRNGVRRLLNCRVENVWNEVSRIGNEYYEQFLSNTQVVCNCGFHAINNLYAEMYSLLTFTLFFLLRIYHIWAAYFSQFSLREPEHDPCYDNAGRPIRCVPDFINAAFGKPVTASNTCGQYGPSRYCSLRENAMGVMEEVCNICDASSKTQSHPASHLTDLNNLQNVTCWMSEPSTEYPHNVTLTLSLGKKYELTYISVQFCNRLADSMAFYKSMDFGKTWIPFQFYSTECQKIYDRNPSIKIGKHNEQEALCTNTHALTSMPNRVAFATLEGRPSAFEFEHSPVLQDWVTATDIRIIFNRLSPDQAELYGLTNEIGVNITDMDQLKQRYYYSVGELAVGGRCKCNGHASRCILDKTGNYICDCKHNTAGADCEHCKTFHLDRPWGRATSENANHCVGREETLSLDDADRILALIPLHSKNNTFMGLIIGGTIIITFFFPSRPLLHLSYQTVKLSIYIHE
uniref:BMA-UNC-6, isoform b n=1 Tax=Brugia malayi TaxID=6279 RepID=A0A1I9G4X0_BRUMA|nr:BMA-UNC-6, isoform b [Brugia malayi]